jgi:hypothetical protein
MTMPVEDSNNRVVNDLISALKTNPACLAAICLAAVFAFLTYFALQADADRRAKTVDLVLSRCFDQMKGPKT